MGRDGNRRFYSMFYSPCGIGMLAWDGTDIRHDYGSLIILFFNP